MCGIAGFLNATMREEEGRTRVAAMARSLRHRGPDAHGLWVDAAAGVALGHRRLAIVDLSPAGHQPMCSGSGRYVLVFNGEIYNHLDLRRTLDAPEGGWRGRSDTETLLAGLECWGLPVVLERSVGMFALAVWDRLRSVLTLARDRFGEKPLYYGWLGAGTFAFGSELKALRALPEFRNPVDRLALVRYLHFQNVPAPWSIFERIYKLEPGCLLTVSVAGAAAAPGRPLRPGEARDGSVMTRWWDAEAEARRCAHRRVDGEPDGLQQLDDALQRAVRQQAQADVPLGAFLSGGVDSSLITALMQRQAREAGQPPVRTFTIGFAERGYDEAPFARAVAGHLGTHHHELRVTAADVQAVIPRLPSMYDEPFADASQLPTHLVCRAARAEVTVALSGDGGDELFGGYNRYLWAPRLWARTGWLPVSLRQGLCRMVDLAPEVVWDGLGSLARVNRLGDKAAKLAARLGHVTSLDELYWSLLGEWSRPWELVPGIGEPHATMALEEGRLGRGTPMDGMADPRERMMWLDSQTYLPDDILCKVDRASMAVSLETRAPFLDHRVAEVAWRLPPTMKIRGGVGKWALRQLLFRHVPRALIERPKTGFGIPVGQWLRGPLRDWASDLLAPRALERHGFLRAAPIHAAWREHLSGRRDWTSRLWTVLMFQAWMLDGTAPLPGRLDPVDHRGA